MVFCVETRQQENHSQIVLFGRDENNNKYETVIDDFTPYFYVHEDENIPEDFRIQKIESGFKSLTGESVKKLSVRKSTDVSDLRNKFSRTYEADVLFNQRYIIDVLGEVTPYKLRVLGFDIETTDEGGYPDFETADKCVTAISFKDNFTGDRIKMLYKHPECTEEIIMDDGVLVFDSEEELLGRFVAFVKEYDPDVITGWNVEFFDLTYLIRRMERLGVEYKSISPMHTVYIDDYYNNVHIKGRVVLDGMEAYKHFRRISNQGQAESYSLEFTAQNVLKTGKLEHTESFHELWVNKPNKLLEYNMRDVDLVMDIDEELQIIDFFNTIRCKACAGLDRIYTTSVLVDGLLLRKTHGNVVLPSKYKQEGKKYSGAFVVEPKPGLYDYVLALDIKGMYPNLIKTFNVSYETFNPNGDIKITDDIGFDNGRGLIPQTIMDLEIERNDYKKLYKNALADKNKKLITMYHFRQYAVKVLANSIYGYLGYPGSRLYKPQVAEAITIMGRNLIKYTQEVLNKDNYEIIYGDTDSVYVQSQETSPFKILAEGKRLIGLINESYKPFAKQYGSDICTLEMEFEKVFKRILFVAKRNSEEGAKKKYAYLLMWAEGKPVSDKIDFTGFDTVRSDNPRISRVAQEKVLNMVINGNTKEDVVDYLMDIEKKIKDGEIPDDEIGFPKGISNELTSYGLSKTNDDGKTYKTGTPPVIAGARYSNKYLGTRFKKGDKPKWIYVSNVPKGYPLTKVITYDDKIPKGFLPNYKLLYDRIFKMKLEEIFRACGFGNFPEMDSSVKTLNVWFGGHKQ